MIKSAVRFTKEQVRALKRIAKEKGLKGAEILDDYTEDEMVESFNGAGSSAEKEWKRKALTKILHKKLPAILIHDMTYRKGGSEEAFRKANADLMDNIITGDEKSLWWKFVGKKAKEYSDRRGRAGWGVV